MRSLPATMTEAVSADDSGELIALPTDLLAPGTRVGEYVVGGVLGQGAAGAVYEAMHPVIGKRAAVKVMSQKFCGDRALATRFVNEARAVNTIRHRNVVDVFSFGQLPDGRLYFIMEMLEGETLQAYLRRRTKLEIDEALQIFTAIAEALEATHRAGIVHRDLKPANVFLSMDDDGGMTPKLLDFGVAKLALPEAPRDVRMLAMGAVDATGEGAILGTPSYMAPEQCTGAEVTTRADVYAFGVMLHRALTGRLPFERGHALGMAIAHATQPPPAMSAMSDLPPAFDGPILRMLAKDAADRPESVSAALAELSAAVRASRARPRRPKQSALRATRRHTFKRRILAKAVAPEVVTPPAQPVLAREKKPVGWLWPLPFVLLALAWFLAR